MQRFLPYARAGLVRGAGRVRGLPRVGRGGAPCTHERPVRLKSRRRGVPTRPSDFLIDLNRLYKSHPALFEADVDSAGFQWIDSNNADDNAVAFLRKSPATGRQILVTGNFSPVIRNGYRVGVPKPGYYREMMNTDSHIYGGSNFGNGGGVEAQALACHGLPYSVVVSLPPLAVVWFEVP